MFHQKVIWITLGVGLIVTGPGCGPADPSGAQKPGADTAAAAAERRVYEVNGVLKEVRPAERKVRITHEKIPGYMEAMTMVFEVRDDSDLTALEPGDPVAFRMVVTPTDGWIEGLRRRPGPRENVEPNDGIRVVRDVDPLQIGDPLPDYLLTNQLGQPVHLANYKGQALAITFIYTRCPFPTFCPRMSTNFADVQQKLLSMPNAPTNWHLISVSFDPEFDTPEVLRAYAERYGADPKRWELCTGALIDITALAEQCGVLFWRPNPAAPTDITHNLRTVVVDAAGRVRTIFKENKWTVDELAAELVKAAAVRPASASGS